MNKKKYYYNTKFPAEVIKKTHDLFLTKTKTKGEPQELYVGYENEGWSFDTLEEFFAEYPKVNSYLFDHFADNNRLIYNFDNNKTYVKVEFPSRRDIESIFEILETKLDISKITVTSEPVKIFIGHGNNKQWRDLKDHLHDHHGLKIITYEIGPRAGLSVKEVLESMLNESSFAFLILTGEDIDSYGEIHARENVIHELGLFQGKLGFERAIILLEKEVTEFSNILGINQIRFSKGNIRETFGDVLATIKRELD